MPPTKLIWFPILYFIYLTIKKALGLSLAERKALSGDVDFPIAGGSSIIDIYTYII